MSIHAHAGPLVVFKENPLSTIGTFSANMNPQAGPSTLYQATALLDVRQPYTYYPGMGTFVGGTQGTPTVYGWLGGPGGYQCIDQIPSALSAANISASASPGSSALTLVSSSGAGITVATSIVRADTGATVTGLLAIDGAMAGVPFGQDGSISMWDPTKAVSRNIRITSGGNDSGITFAVVGYDLYGYPMSEAITGANAGVAAGKKAFKYITSITPSGAAASTVSAGTGDVYGLPLRADRIPYVQCWWGSPQSLVVGGGGTVSNGAGGVVAGQDTVTLPMPTLTAVANGNVFAAIVPFSFTVVSAAFVVEAAVTTGGKTATITMGINGTAMTGGVITLTSAAATPAGNIVPATAITGANTSPSWQSVVTMTQANPGVVTWPNHGLVATTPVVFTISTGGTLPTNITAGTVYYVIAAGLTTNAFEVATTSGGSAINTTAGTLAGTLTATALNSITATVSAVTAFSEGFGYIEVLVVDNSMAGGNFTGAVTTAATTTTGDTRGTIAMSDNSDGLKRLTLFISPSVANSGTATGQTGVTQNLASNNG